jgi:hypothetical protein
VRLPRVAAGQVCGGQDEQATSEVGGLRGQAQVEGDGSGDRTGGVGFDLPVDQILAAPRRNVAGNVRRYILQDSTMVVPAASSSVKASNIPCASAGASWRPWWIRCSKLRSESYFGAKVQEPSLRLGRGTRL